MPQLPVKIAGPAWSCRQNRASCKATTSAFYLVQGCGTVTEIPGLLLMGATSLSQKCPDKPPWPQADKGLKGEESHMVQTLLLLIRYFDTQLTANLL